MSPHTAISSLGFVLEHPDLLVPILLLHVSDNPGSVHPWTSNGRFAVFGEGQHVAELNLCAWLHRQFVHVNNVAGRNPVLLAARFKNCVIHNL